MKGGQEHTGQSGAQPLCRGPMCFFQAPRMKITVRPATEADLPGLLSLHGELHLDNTPLPETRAQAVWAGMAQMLAALGLATGNRKVAR